MGTAPAADRNCDDCNKGLIGNNWFHLLDYRCDATEAGIALGSGHDGGSCLDDDALARAQICAATNHNINQLRTATFDGEAAFSGQQPASSKRQVHQVNLMHPQHGTT